MIKWIKKQIGKLLKNYPLVRWILIGISGAISVVLIILAAVYIRQLFFWLFGGATALGGVIAYNEISKKVKEVKKKNENPDYNSTSNSLDGVAKRKRKAR